MEKINLLIVDDEDRFLTSTAKLLGKRGYTIFTASDAAKALKVLEAEAIQLALLDVKMPGMNGIDLLREIKKRWPLVEVVMLTGHATFDSAVTGLKTGASDYLMKPAHPDELLQKLQEAFEKRKISEEKIRHGRS